jgi:IS1 family transposase
MGYSDIGLVVIVVVIIAALFLFLARRKGSTGDDVKREPMLQLVRQNFAKINPKYDKIPLYEGGSSYTEDKNSIVLCLKDPHTGSMYDANTVMYVALHELAHVISKTYSVESHNDEFKKNFQNLLNRAQQLGMYNPNKPIPPNYCGIDH